MNALESIIATFSIVLFCFGCLYLLIQFLDKRANKAEMFCDECGRKITDKYYREVSGSIPIHYFHEKCWYKIKRNGSMNISIKAK